jgi:hypothetical protein
MNRHDPRSFQRVQHLVERLHEFGPRVATEFLFDFDKRIGTGTAICNLLEEYTQRLNPSLIYASGADRFPPTLSVVPDDIRPGIRSAHR